MTAYHGFNLKVNSAAGASADTNIAVSGIETDDVLLSVIEVTVTTAALIDRTSACSITSSGQIQCTADTSSDFLLIFWNDSNG